MERLSYDLLASIRLETLKNQRERLLAKVARIDKDIEKLTLQYESPDNLTARPRIGTSNTVRYFDETGKRLKPIQ